MAQTALGNPPSVGESTQLTPAEKVEFGSECFQNRDISWLQSHAQIIDVVEDATEPLARRLSFLAFFSEKLDAFYRVRVAALRRKCLRSGPPEKTRSEAASAEAFRQLQAILNHAQQLVARQYHCWTHAIRPALCRAGIQVVRGYELEDAQRARLDEFFFESLAPILTPLAIDSCHPKPAFVNQCLYLGALLSSNTRLGPNTLIATVQLPSAVRRFIPVGGERPTFVLLEDVVAANLHRLFGGYVVTDWSVFRFTRDSYVETADRNPDCALCDAKSRLAAGRRGDVVRLEVSAGANPKIVGSLGNEDAVSLDSIPGPLDLRALVELKEILQRGKKQRRSGRSSTKKSGHGTDMFAKIAKRDVLLHHPWQSFVPVVDFLEQAASDPDVLSIHQTLYRIGDDNPLIAPLVRAADHGKQVTALVELNARFGEGENIRWARQLEQDGVHVVFGFSDLKTHCKLALVVRQEANRIKRYVHLATGNYHHTTVPYTDLGLLTANDDIGADAASIFNMLTGYSVTHEWRKLAVAPDNLYSRTTELIQEQRERARNGLASRIFAKVNSLTDSTVIEALYAASQDGVPIELVISGACTLRPGLAGISDNIRVRGIVHKYREHSRLLVFGPDDAAKVFLMSADWMPRNFHRRVEVMCPIEEPDLQHHVLRSIVPAYVGGSPKARYLQPDGSYATLVVG